MPSECVGKVADMAPSTAIEEPTQYQLLREMPKTARPRQYLSYIPQVATINRVITLNYTCDSAVVNAYTPPAVYSCVLLRLV